MDYIGSKVKLVEWMFSIIKEAVPSSGTVFLDACSGSGAVSRAAAALGYRVVANDLMTFPSVIANGSIGLTRCQLNRAESEIERINKMTGKDGYFRRFFCDKSHPPRAYFTSCNACSIDRARHEISRVEDAKVRDYLLYCGLEAMSRVCNTTGVQAAFLKGFKERAIEDFELREEEVVGGSVESFRGDIISLLGDDGFRSSHKEYVLYIDPPYNQRQYGPNYHLYETFVRDDNPTPRGKTGLRDWKNECHSAFCSSRTCLDFLKKIVSSTSAKWVFVSYSSDGILKVDDIKRAFPNVRVHVRGQKRYRSDVSMGRVYDTSRLEEYLFQIAI